MVTNIRKRIPGQRSPDAWIHLLARSSLKLKQVCQQTYQMSNPNRGLGFSNRKQDTKVRTTKEQGLGHSSTMKRSKTTFGKVPADVRGPTSQDHDEAKKRDQQFWPTKNGPNLCIARGQPCQPPFAENTENLQETLPDTRIDVYNSDSDSYPDWDTLESLGSDNSEPRNQIETLQEAVADIQQCIQSIQTDIGSIVKSIETLSRRENQLEEKYEFDMRRLRVILGKHKARIANYTKPETKKRKVPTRYVRRYVGAPAKRRRSTPTPVELPALHRTGTLKRTNSSFMPASRPDTAGGGYDSYCDSDNDYSDF